VILLLLPTIVLAQGLVPCGGPSQPDCQFCHFASLIDNVLNWLVAVATLVVVIVLVVGGVMLSSSGGNVAIKDTVRRIISQVLVGFIILLVAWFVVDFLLRAFAGPAASSTLGPWSVISCVAQPVIK
jgi:uncharacterized RDD family membrane protein YckC